MQKFEFRFDIEDYKNTQELLTAVKNVIKLANETSFIEKLNQRMGDKPIVQRKGNITLRIFKSYEDV